MIILPYLESIMDFINNYAFVGLFGLITIGCILNTMVFIRIGDGFAEKLGLFCMMGIPSLTIGFMTMMLAVQCLVAANLDISWVQVLNPHSAR